MDRVIEQLPRFLSPLNLWFLAEAMGMTLALTFFGCGPASITALAEKGERPLLEKVSVPFRASFRPAVTRSIRALRVWAPGRLRA